MKKVTLDGVEYQAEAAVIVALSTAKQRADDAEKAQKSAEEQYKKDFSVLEAERDSLKEKLDAKDKELEKVKAEKMDQAAIDAAVNEKLALILQLKKQGLRKAE
jgi:hypothetical protein